MIRPYWLKISANTYARSKPLPRPSTDISNELDQFNSLPALQEEISLNMLPISLNSSRTHLQNTYISPTALSSTCITVNSWVLPSPEHSIHPYALHIATPHSLTTLTPGKVVKATLLLCLEVPLTGRPASRGLLRHL